MNQQSDTNNIKRSLTALGDSTPPNWQQSRDDFARRADKGGLIEVAVEHHEAPFGELILCVTDEGLVRLALPTEDPDAILATIATKVSPAIVRTPRKSLTKARRQLDEYFNGKRRSFEIPLDWRLTSGFRREVLRATEKIPYGETATYSEMAAEAGSPGASRAAGTALATNPLPIVVPCHRVVRAGGVIGNYGGGVERKCELLRLEGFL